MMRLSLLALSATLAACQQQPPLPANRTPQIVLMTFDDSVNDKNMAYYSRLFFNSSRRNANGCKTAATLFLSHEWTNYAQVNQLYGAGFEVAEHSITHRHPQEWWSNNASAEDWRKEVEGMNTIITKVEDT
jgi:hypothetical protein